MTSKGIWNAGDTQSDPASCAELESLLHSLLAALQYHDMYDSLCGERLRLIS